MAKCKCRRVQLGDFHGIGSTDPADETYGSHTEQACFDTDGNKLSKTRRKGDE
jgi:hypothetical protein